MLVSDLREELNKLEENQEKRTEASFTERYNSPKKDYAQELELLKLKDENENLARAVQDNKLTCIAKG